VDCHLCFQDGNDGQGTTHFFKIVVCSAYTCPSRQVGFQHLCDVYPRVDTHQIPYFPSRKQDTGRKEFRATFKKTKTRVRSIMFLALSAVLISKHFSEGPVAPFHILYLFLQDPVPLQLHLSTG
jgi:hypothetical protein